MLNIRITGRKAIPIRAIPYTSSWLLSPLDVVTLLRSPETHIDEFHSIPVLGYRLNSERFPQLIYPNEFDRFHADITNSQESGISRIEELRLLPPSVFVWHEEIKSFYDRLYAVMAEKRAKHHGLERWGDWAWNENPYVSAEERNAIFEGFMPEDTPTHHRINSKASTLVRVEAALQKLESLLATNEINIDRKNLPCSYEQLGNVLITIDSTIRRSPDVFKDHLRSLGCQGKTGRKAPNLQLDAIFNRIIQGEIKIP